MGRKRRQKQNPKKSLSPFEGVEGKLQQAISLYQAGQLPQAEQRCQQILRDFPQHADALHLLGVIACQVEEYKIATDLISRALEIGSNQSQPQFSEMYNNLGNALLGQGNLEESIQAYQQAIHIQPQFSEAYYNLGNALRKQGKLEESIKAYQQSIRLQLDHVEAHNNLGIALEEQGKLEESIKNYQQAIHLRPDYAVVYGNLGTVLQKQGKLEESIKAYQQVIHLQPDDVAGYSNLIFAQDFHLGIDLKEQQIERQKWNQRFILPLADSIQSHPNDRNPQRILRIGYVSADFRQHSAAQGFGQLILNYNQTQFEVFCYSGVVKEDKITKRFKDAASGWYSTIGKSDKELVQRIRNDEIDILVDLSGHTSGNRLLAFGYKPAPIQVTGIGCCPPGVTTIDYRLTTPIFSHPEEEKHFVESPVYLDSIMGFMIPLEIPFVGCLPAHENRYVTFGCLNRFSKVSGESLELWASLLKRIPDSKLLLKSGELNDRELREHTVERLSDLGVSSNRVILLGGTSRYEHLNTYNQVDISLDPFPYAGGVTTLESLCMGAPVVGLTDTSKLVHRSSSVILSPLGLGEWAAKTKDEYVEIVCNWVRNLGELAELRRELRDRVLTRAAKFAPQVEVGYREMWSRWCSGGKPSAIYIK